MEGHDFKLEELAVHIVLENKIPSFQEVVGHVKDVLHAHYLYFRFVVEFSRQYEENSMMKRQCEYLMHRMKMMFDLHTNQYQMRAKVDSLEYCLKSIGSIPKEEDDGLHGCSAQMEE